jgi:hypothetical protein
MNGKQIEKRAIKGYKIKDSVYRKAMRRAKKDKTNLANKIELWVALYADGCDMIARPADFPNNK